MYKLVLVDDNEIVLEGFREKINLKGLGIELSGVAANGKEALELIREKNPDILITDIKMPKMTGMELIEAIRKTNGRMKVVILSGYGDFEYARRAISLNAVEYLLKPILKGDIERTLAKIVESLKGEETEAIRQARLEERSRRNSEIVKSHVLHGLLEGRVEDLEKAGELLASEGIDFREKKAVVALMEPDSGTGAASETLNGLLAAALSAAGGGCAGVLAGERRIALVLACGGGCKDRQAEEKCGRALLGIREAIKRSHGVSVTISAGTAVSGIPDIRASFLQACEAMEYRLILGGGAVIAYSGIAARKAGKSARFCESVEKVLDAAKSGDRDGIAGAVDDFYAGIAAKCDCTPADVAGASYKLALAAREIAQDAGAPASASEADLWEQLKAMDSLEGIRGWVKGLFAAALQAADSRSRYSRIVSFVLDSVGRSYDKELLLKDMAKEMYISENYLTTLFKRETGTTFKKYMTNVRMQKAAELLRDPKYKVYEIAGLVGYDSEEHFCRMFKETMGVTPKDYRNGARSVISDRAGFPS